MYNIYTVDSSKHSHDLLAH